MALHKNKTFATLLASVAGGIGAHRFYLFGLRDFWAWAHLVAVLLALLLIAVKPDSPLLFAGSPLLISVLAAFIEALVIGLTSDDKWDRRHNCASGHQSSSRWPLALILVLTLGVGAIVVIAAMARAFDLLFTGGAYG